MLHSFVRPNLRAPAQRNAAHERPGVDGEQLQTLRENKLADARVRRRAVLSVGGENCYTLLAEACAQVGKVRRPNLAERQLGESCDHSFVVGAAEDIRELGRDVQG